MKTNTSKTDEPRPLNKHGVGSSEDYTYKAQVAWTFPYVGVSIIDIKGSCMEDAVNKFYKSGGGEILQIFE